MDRIRPARHQFILYLFPVILFFSFVVVLPIVYAGYYSFFDWRGGPERTFHGWTHYQTLLQDEVFWRAFRNNVYITVLCIVGQIGSAFIFAMMLNTRVAKLKGIHRTLCYFPVTLSAVVIGFVWDMVYNYRFGALNGLLEAMGQEHLRQAWLSNPDLVLTLVSIPLIWQFIGFYMVIFLSAFTSIDANVLEMAELDGANGFQRMVHIAMPLLKNTFVVAVILCISGNMRIFDHIFIMTRGGPGTASTVMAQYAFNVSFARHDLGYGSAVSIGLLVLSMIFVLGARGIMHVLFMREKGIRKGAA